jgi:hypothetical protein
MEFSSVNAIALLHSLTNVGEHFQLLLILLEGGLHAEMEGGPVKQRRVVREGNPPMLTGFSPHGILSPAAAAAGSATPFLGHNARLLNGKADQTLGRP